jgi:hypothetical protein
MTSKPASKGKKSFLGTLGIAIIAALVLGTYLFFGRLIAGSWRQFGALALAATTYLVSMALLKRVVRPQAAMDWRRMSIAFPFMGALAGGAYTLVSTASGIAAAVTGVVWGLIHLWLIWRQMRGLAAEAR